MSENLEHYGTPRKSGRFPYGSGKNPQRSQDLLSVIDKHRANGMSDKDIASELGMTTTQLRSEISWANKSRKEALMDSVKSRKERGESNTKIAKDLGISEASVRNYMSSKDVIKENQLDMTKKVLEESIKEHTYLDIGAGVERQMGISKEKMKAAVAKLKEEGYVEHEIYVRRLTDRSKYTTVKVLTKEKDLEVVKQNSNMIRPVEAWTDDGGLSYQGLKPIKKVDWDRVEIRYGDKGGEERDGTIELRRNVKDLDLGNANYAQVRIGVGKEHYLKGMALYSDDIPKGKDIIFNTNKPSGTPREKVLKELKKREDGSVNMDNPFGATIKPGGQKGALNIVNEEGDWSSWKSTLSSQFLSKQPLKLVKERMDATYSNLVAERDEIMTITNPVVKKFVLDKFSDGLGSKAKHLKAQGLPRTAGHVILPFPEMKANEVYAPNYKDGDKVVLVRYPHGGTFELPELKVNNKGVAKKTIGNAKDAIGIHPSVASKLSGADFDGDTVYVIPNNQGKIKTSRSLTELKNFDPNVYAVSHTTISPKRKQKEMGVVSNLITDMTIKGASQAELARAVRHSMVVIDSEKHKLDYKRSAQDNAIGALQKRYQTHISPLDGKSHKGASTLISQSKKEILVGATKTVIKDPKTGKNKTMMTGGKKVSIIDMFDDARKLSSGTAVENVYADYVNKVKSMQNATSKAARAIKPIKKDKAAAQKYAPEVKSLDSKLNAALLNAPLERQAQIMATNTYYKNLSYNMDSDQKKKLKAQSLAGARIKVGAKRAVINVTPNEWKAIQSGAVSNDKLEKILKNSDMDKIRDYATPKRQVKLTAAKASRAKGLIARGYTYSEVAEALGLSTTAIRNALG